MKIYTLNHRFFKLDGKLMSVPPPPPSDEVTIGTQTWKRTNLAIDDGQGGIYTQTVNYGQGDVIEYYYSWDAAVRIAASIPGWHLPYDTEWDTLIAQIGGSLTAGDKLKSTYGWEHSGNGTDNYGFSALPSGYWDDDFSHFGYYVGFWTATEYTSIKSYYKYLDRSSKLYTGTNGKYIGMSVRLVKGS